MPDIVNLPSLQPIAPELVLAVGAMVLLMIGVMRGDRATPLVSTLAIILIGVAGALVVFAPAGKTVAFNGSFVLDDYARFLKVLALIGSGVAILMSIEFLEAIGKQRFEYPVLIVLSTTGMLVLVSAGDLIALYLGFELMSLALYVIAAIDRDNARSTEAGLKYFVLGALSSGMLLYGCSLIYGFTGTVTFTGIAKASTSGGIGLIFGLVFLFAGFCFKVSAVPFHMWTPDVYEGAPTPVTAFFSVAPKIAALALFVRVMIYPFGDLIEQWRLIIWLISVGSMALGSFAAINQRNIKRLMAYSSIGHIGYALIGLAAGSEAGVRGILVYMSIYLFMNIGTFAVILCMRRNGKMVEGIDDLAGLSRTQPALALALGIFMFSMAGIPPLAGFFAKFYIFMAAINAGLFGLAVIGVVTSVVGAYYYVRIVKLMYFDEPAGAFYPVIGGEIQAVLVVSAVVILFFFLVPGPIVAGADAATAALFAG